MTTSTGVQTVPGVPKLRALIERVWLPAGFADTPVAVSLGSPPRGHHVVETYAILPSASRPRYLVPLGSRAAAVATLWTYHTMRGPVRQAAEASVSALFRAGVAPALFRHRLVVSIDGKVPPAERGRWLILHHLAQVLGHGRLFAGLAVRKVIPNSKPMLELFDEGGTARGYAKVGWSLATKSLVRSEATALAELAGRLQDVVAPSLLAQGAFNDAYYSVASPLPRKLRRWSTDPLVSPDATLAVARSSRLFAGPFAGSPYARSVAQRLDDSSNFAPEVTKLLGVWLTGLEQSTTPVPFGRSHGDWVPHNLGHSAGQVAAWDWEHSRPDAPIGFDALHWHFQARLPRSGLAAAVSEVDRAAAALGTFGVASAARELVASLYLLETFVRATALAAGGGGWNPRLYPALLEVAGRRTTR